MNTINTSIANTLREFQSALIVDVHGKPLRNGLRIRLIGTVQIPFSLDGARCMFVGSAHGVVIDVGERGFRFTPYVNAVASRYISNSSFQPTRDLG